MKLLTRIATITAIAALFACSDANQVDPDSPIQPKYSAETRELSQLKVDQITTAPLQYFGAVQLNKTPEEAYIYFSDLENEWLPGEITKLDHSNSQIPGQTGIGTLRYVKSSSEFAEAITYWEEGVGYGYSIPDEAGLPMTNHLGVLQLEGDGKGGCVMTYRQYFSPPESLKGKLISMALRFVLNKSLDELADKFGGERL